MYILFIISISTVIVVYSFIKRRNFDVQIQNNLHSFTYNAFLDMNNNNPNYYRLTEILVKDLNNVKLNHEIINQKDFGTIAKSEKMIKKGFVDERMFAKIKFLHSMYIQK